MDFSNDYYEGYADGVRNVFNVIQYYDPASASQEEWAEMVLKVAAMMNAANKDSLESGD